VIRSWDNAVPKLGRKNVALRPAFSVIPNEGEKSLNHAFGHTANAV